VEKELLPPHLELLRKRARFIDAFQREPKRVTMHPRVFADLIMLLKPWELALDLACATCTIMGMEIVEDTDAPGIAMILE
jgi:hypothetical protein